MEKLYTIDDFREHTLRGTTEGIFGKDYVIRHLRPGDLASYDEEPEKYISLAGLMLTIVRKGTLSVGFENKEFTAGENTMFPIPPTICARISSDNWAETEVSIVYLSREFLQTLNFSVSAFSGPVVLEGTSPVCRVLPGDGEILEHYCELLTLTAGQPVHTRLTRHCASSLCVALMYHSMEMFMRQLEASGESPESAHGQKTRSAHVRSFLRLVHANFTRERSVGFYASELCVSPKYLSALVKESTGRTAARWIEDYVIMEAKNLLRFSGKNVQQVAYALNFANQSAFGKYFKHLTGMSPSEFQKS